MRRPASRLAIAVVVVVKAFACSEELTAAGLVERGASDVGATASSSGCCPDRTRCMALLEQDARGRRCLLREFIENRRREVVGL